MSAAAGEHRFARGESILVEDGRPAEHLYVVRSGAVELRHEGDVVDVLQAGELFGHPSLLTRMAPAFDVVARSDAVCLLLPPAVARMVLESPAGVEFVASSLRERMVRSGHVAHAQADVRTAHLGTLMHRPAVVCEPGTSVAEAARRMAEADVSCVLVTTPGGFGVLTDSDLRSKLVAAGGSYETPVEELMVAPALVFPADRLAIDAMIDMLDAGIHHLPVVDGSGRPVGVVTATDLMYLEGRTPFALRRSIAHARSAEEVIAAARHLPQTVVALVRAGVSAIDVGRVIALTTDTTTLRLVELGFEQHGEAPGAWAWLALGSTARREGTLASDQDNAMAYADPPDGVEVDDLYALVAAGVNAGLAACGLGADPAEVLARNRQWRMSTSEWVRVFGDVLDQPDRSHLTRAAVAFDFRQVGGGLEVVRPLVEIERRARDHPAFLRRLARTATDFKPALGFRGRFAVDDNGQIDLKHGAAVPIANLARFHALACGVTISPTLDRLAGAEAEGSLDGETAAALREAFAAVARIRMEHQVAQVEAGRAADNMVDPAALAPITRAELRASLRAVQAAQRGLERFVPLGM